MPNPENLVPFKEGEDPRRNSTGKNKGAQWSKTIIRKFFDQEIEGEDLEGETRKIPAGELAIIATIKKAIKGDTKSLKELLDRLEGTPIQTVNQNLTGKINRPITEWVDTPGSETDEA